MALRAELVDDAADLEEVVADWDALAVAARRPYCTPAWQLAWWRHARPPGALLRALVVRDGDGLVGIAPLYFRHSRLTGWEGAPLATPVTSRLEPLAAPGREEAMARALAETLAWTQPQPAVLRFSQIPAASPWPRLVREAWPGIPPRLVRERRDVAPCLALAANDLDGWLATKSRNFRSQVRRARRALERQGATFRIATTPAELERDLADFVRLHRARWDWRGGSVALTPGMDRALAEAARTLAPQGRLRLASIDVAGRTVGSLLLLAAGGQVAYWNGGYDEAFAKQHPGLVGLVVAIEHALAGGDAEFDLGPGDQHYKLRLADETEELATVAVVPTRALRAGTRVLARRGRQVLSAHLTPEQKRRIRALLDRVPG